MYLSTDFFNNHGDLNIAIHFFLRYQIDIKTKGVIFLDVTKDWGNKTINE